MPAIRRTTAAADPTVAFVSLAPRGGALARRFGLAAGRAGLVALFFAVPAAPVSAQDALATRIEAVRSATAAGDHALATALADSLVAWAPEHPNAVFARAIARAAAGRDQDAAGDVRTLLRWDPRFARRALQDSTLAHVGPLLADLDIESQAERAERPVARGHVWAVLEERDLVAEGTAWDPATRSLLVGSLNKNKVVAIARDGAVSDRVPAGAHGLGSVVGIHVDSARGLLWVTSTPRFDTPSDTTTPALFAFEAATGEFRRRVDAPPGPSFPNDLTTGPDGTVYVTDTRAGRILVLGPDAQAFDSLATSAPVSAPNGITISDDGGHLFFSHLDHVRVVSLAEGRDWRLAVPDSVTLAAIDGLAFADGALIAHHPGEFRRIARYELDPGFRRVVGREYIEKSTPDPRTSTTGEVGGDHYYYIGNGQIDRMNQGTIDSATMAPIRMYRVALPPPPPGTVAVALSGVDSVALFDAQSLERVGALPVGRTPHELTTAADGATVYVADARDSTITRLELLPSPRVAARWPLPDGVSVHDVAAGDDGLVWAVAAEPPTLFALDAATGALRHRHLLQRPGSWLLDAGGGGAIAVANLEGGAVTLVARESGEQSVLPAAEGEIDAVMTPDGREVWSVNSRTGDLTVFDVLSGAVVSKWFTGPGASRLVFTPDGRRALVVHGGDGTVVAYDSETKDRVASVRVGESPKVIALSPDGRRAYVTHPAGALTLIDVPSMTVLRSVPLEGTPDGVAVAETTAHP